MRVVLWADAAMGIVSAASGPRRVSGRGGLCCRTADEPADGVEVGSLRRRRQIADRHVLDHAPTERAHLGHRGISCLRVALRQPQSSRQETSMAIPAYLPRQRVSSILKMHYHERICQSSVLYAIILYLVSCILYLVSCGEWVRDPGISLH